MNRSWNECSSSYTCDGICMVCTCKAVIIKSRLFTEEKMIYCIQPVPHYNEHSCVHNSKKFVIISFLCKMQG